jgi:hypothetical protein
MVHPRCVRMKVCLPTLLLFLLLFLLLLLCRSRLPRGHRQLVRRAGCSGLQPRNSRQAHHGLMGPASSRSSSAYEHSLHSRQVQHGLMQPAAAACPSVQQAPASRQQAGASRCDQPASTGTAAVHWSTTCKMPSAWRAWCRVRCVVYIHHGLKCSCTHALRRAVAHVAQGVSVS